MFGHHYHSFFSPPVPRFGTTLSMGGPQDIVDTRRSRLAVRSAPSRLDTGRPARDTGGLDTIKPSRSGHWGRAAPSPVRGPLRGPPALRASRRDASRVPAKQIFRFESSRIGMIQNKSPQWPGKGSFMLLLGPTMVVIILLGSVHLFWLCRGVKW